MRDGFMLRDRMIKICYFLFAALLCAPVVLAQTVLRADGHTDTYTLMTDVLGAGPEVPDCSDPKFGPHITQAIDAELHKYVFQFHSHAKADNDRCINFDRQRNEIKTAASSPAAVKAFSGDTMNFRWRFKLDEAFQPSSRFTHIHQIKAGDGNAGAPLITFTPGDENTFKVGYFPDSGPSVTLATTALRPLLGTWLEANETVTFAKHGSLSIRIMRVSDGKVLLNYENPDIDLLRTRSTFYRPKWGVYRSLRDPGAIRDETVLFDDFCIAKAPLTCPMPSAGSLPAKLADKQPSNSTPDFTLELIPASVTAIAGGKAKFEVSIKPINGFKGNISLKAGALPHGMTAQVSPDVVRTGSGSATVMIQTERSTTIDKHTISITAESGSVVHTSPVTLILKPAAEALP
jgi:hypothetical protein